MTTKQKTAVIIGAGPAGITAAYELLETTDVVPVIYEDNDYVGGLSATAVYKGNRIDIGGHRFFSKSDRVINWWLKILPLEKHGGGDHTIAYHRKTRAVPSSEAGPDPDTAERVMLVRPRRSRIYFNRRFFEYPIRLNGDTLKKLGALASLRIGSSYLRSAFFPIRDEKNLEEFFINRFGKVLYRTFFKSYTEKVWGVPCREIGADWGRQRIKGLSLGKAVAHFLKSIIGRSRSGGNTAKNTETSLIEQFLYPKYGPGHMWETAAEIIRKKGGEIHLGSRVIGFARDGTQRIASVTVQNKKTGKRMTKRGDYFFSTMPVKDLVRAMGSPAPQAVRAASDGLIYRDFITVGLLVKKLTEAVPDTWMYIQEPEVRMSRIQIFNNWSPYMVRDPKTTVWLGIEYVCSEGDDVWNMTNEAIGELATEELARIGLVEKGMVLDKTVLRVPKAYPAYFGSYREFPAIRAYFDSFENLFLIGRNGMHKYNNQDHSMLTAMAAVENIRRGIASKDNIWAVNTEPEYHETA